MFVIREIFVDDKKLATFLQHCAGLVHSMGPPMPVANVQVKNGKLIEQTATGTAFDLFYQHLTKSRLRTFNIKLVQEFLPTIGKNPSSANYVVNELKKSKRVKNDPKQRSYYIVT